MIKLIFNFLFFSSTLIFSQCVNGYASVSSVAGTTINIANVNESDDTFEDGDDIIIMQMQDDVIGTTTNTSSFGDLGSIQSAGLYEVGVIVSHTEIAGVPTSVTIASAFNNTYNIGIHSSIQILTFPKFGSPNYTTVSNVTTMAWDGTVGGVTAFQVPGTLTLAHNISADGSGFRGGADDASPSLGGCYHSTYIAVTTFHAPKGEGIYLNTNASFEAARGKMLNGGGGGSSHNSGGGGGGNYTAGGVGGKGWGCHSSATLEAGGLGGIELSAQITSSRLFLGGGGGAGEKNNSNDTHGGSGGGIIIIKANEIVTTGTCAGISISADGESTNDVTNDGAGGAGAGGTIFFDVNTWNIVGTCDLSISTSGGDGGDVGHVGVHGGGAGGGQGAIIFTVVQPTTNITTSTTSGSGGCNSSATPCITSADPGAGVPDSGVIPSSGNGPLPVSLVEFNVILKYNFAVEINWLTKSEINNDYFVVERSTDGENWSEFKKMNGAGNSSQENSYLIYDKKPYQGFNYYRLVQIDFDGTKHYYDSKAIYIRPLKNLIVYPNPASKHIIIDGYLSNLKDIMLTNASGQNVQFELSIVGGKIQINTSKLVDGIYFIHFVDNEEFHITKKVIIKHN